MASRSRDVKDAPGPLSAPWIQHTYTRLISGAIRMAKRAPPPLKEARARQAVKVAKARRRRRLFIGLAAASLVVAAAVIGGTLGLRSARRSAAAQAQAAANDPRAVVRARLAAGDYVGAKDALSALRRSGQLGDADRLELVSAVDAGMVKLRGELQKRLDEQRAAGKHEAALATLDEMERDGMSGEGMLFARAEVLRQLGQESRARAFYERYSTLYPTTERAGDALFWIATAMAHEGDKAGARRSIDKLLADFPSSGRRSAAKKLLAEIR